MIQYTMKHAYTKAMSVLYPSINHHMTFKKTSYYMHRQDTYFH